MIVDRKIKFFIKNALMDSRTFNIERWGEANLISITKRINMNNHPSGFFQCTLIDGKNTSKYFINEIRFDYSEDKLTLLHFDIYDPNPKVSFETFIGNDDKVTLYLFDDFDKNEILITFDKENDSYGISK